MADERMAKDSAALEEATDRVIREMTQVEVSEDAVTRVMARIRAARGAAVDGAAAAGLAASTQAPAARGWFGTLLEPRVAWSTAAACAALAALIAAGTTAFVLRDSKPLSLQNSAASGGASNPQVATNAAAATPAPASGGSPSVGSLESPGPSAASSGASAPHVADNAAAATPAPASGGSPSVGSLESPGPSAASGGASNPQVATNTAAATPASAAGGSQAAGALERPSTLAASSGASASHVATNAAAGAVARVEHPRRTAAKKSIGASDPTVTAAMVATPDEEQPRAQEAGRAAVPQDVRLDVTINDQSGAGKPVAKTVSMVVADHEGGSIRSETRMPFRQPVPGPAGGNVPVETWNTETLPLNVEAWPTILPDGHIRVKLVLSYRIASATPGAPSGPMATASVTKNLIAVLTDGKPLMVSESADAATDRKVTVEVKATIQK